ncbi:hypothetical protein LEQ06_09480 [Paraclostridium sp. AKS46]|nr:hypothetical protein [Paraclostridium sp. AKS46]
MPWNESSGGYPVQTFRSNSGATYERKGTSNTTWGNWQQIEDTNGAQSKANKALTDAKAYTTTEVTKTNNKVASIETTLNSITSRVSNVETITTTINGNITNLQTRMNSAEQKITVTSIVNSVTEAINNGSSINTVSTTLDKNGLTVKNGAIKIKNQFDKDVFWVDTAGKLTTDNIHIYGLEKAANLEISGTRNKGIGLRSYDGGDRYIDFSSVAVEAGFEASVRSGYHTRLIASGGEFSILPTGSLTVGCCDSNRQLNMVMFSSKETYAKGNLSCEGNLKTSNTLFCREMGHTLGNHIPITCHSPFIVNNNIDSTGTVKSGTLRTSNIAHENGNVGYTIVVHSTLQLNGGIINPSGVVLNQPRFFSFIALNTTTDDEITLDNVIDNIILKESASPNESNSVIDIDVTKLIGTNFVNFSGDTVGINSTEFLKLALLEIQRLKKEVKELRANIK